MKYSSKNFCWNFDEDEVFLCSTAHGFVRSPEEKEPIFSEGCISFFTDSFFAAMGHDEEDGMPSYEDAEVYAEHKSGKPFQAGRVLSSRASGLYGAFYDDYRPEAIKRVKIAQLNSLKENTPAELWLSTDSGKPKAFRGEIVALFPDKPFPVLFEVRDKRFPGATTGSSGAAIVQNGRLVAAVAGANENPATLLYCTAAEQMLVDLYGLLDDIVSNPENGRWTWSDKLSFALSM